MLARVRSERCRRSAARAAARAGRRGAHRRRASTAHRRRAASCVGGETIAVARPCSGPPACAPSPLAARLGAPLDRAGRVVVEPDCALPGHPEVFVIGDMAALRPGRRDGAAARRQPGRDPGWAATSPRNIRRAIARQAARAVPLLRQGDHGDDRPRRAPSRSCGRHRGSRGVVAWLAWAVRPPLVPDRLSQPRGGLPRLDLGLRHLEARRAADHRAPPGAAAARGSTARRYCASAISGK